MTKIHFHMQSTMKRHSDLVMIGIHCSHSLYLYEKLDNQQALFTCLSGTVAKLFVCFKVCIQREMFYLTTYSTHFIYGYMASDI